MSFFSRIGDNIKLLKQKPVFNFLLNKYTIAILIFLLVICVFDTNNIWVLMRTERLIRQQEEQIETRNAEIEQLQNKLHTLNYVQDSLEKFAREEFLFQEEDEDVYIIENLE